MDPADPVEKKDENFEEDYLSAEKDNKTTKKEYYLRDDVTNATNMEKQKGNGNKIDVGDFNITDLTHPYDYNINCLFKWLDRITYVYLYKYIHVYLCD